MDHAAYTTAKNHGNGPASHGMSRAAQKKRKKKPRRSTEETVAGDATTRTSSGSHRGAMISLQSHEGKRKRKPEVKDEEPEEEQEEYSDPPNESDDEAIPMKEAAVQEANGTAAEATDMTVLPEKCHSLSEILLLSSSEPKLRTILKDMTVRQRARCALEFLLQPSGLSTASFYQKYHEKLPLHCSCSTRSTQRTRYDGIWTVSDIRTVLQQKTLLYGTDVNVTRYEKSQQDGVFRRITLDKKKNATNSHEETEYETVQFPDIWKQYETAGCTIRFLCPQQHSTAIHALLSLLEWEFGCMVGANVYLTPAHGAQGFAPHYDDIDAYIVQLQGRKRWKVYAPLQPNERLPRVSSKDYTSADLMQIEPVLDVILEAGDLLYMPRGWIHQACTIPNDSRDGNGDDDDMFSLHLTISTMQQWAWADYMEILLPEALQAAIEAPSTLLREGLPPRFLDYMGAMHDNREELLPDALKRKVEEEDSPTENLSSNADLNTDLEMNLAMKRGLQEEFRALAKKRIMRVAKEAMDMIDAACDQMGKRFLSDRLPPALTESERSTTNNQSSIDQLEPTMMCRLVWPGIARLVLEDGMAVVYHCNDNSVVYHERAISPMEFEMDDAPALEQLLTTVPPHWIAISDLIHDTIDDKVSIAQALFDEGILAIRPETS